MPQDLYLATQEQAADLEGVTQLIVHGVGGTRPERMLDEPNPTQVAGDRISGFYRRGDVDGRHVEAYSWGGLTSHSTTRVLWLLLFPFALGNLAGWMYHPGADRTRETAAFRCLVRLLCLGLTLTYVLWVSAMSLDLVAYQCGAQPACVAGRWWLAPFRAPWFAGHPGRRLALGAIVPLLVIALLGMLTRKARHRYERGAGGNERVTEAPRAAGLASRGFWEGEELVQQLGRLHLTAAVAVLAFALAASGRALDASHDGWSWLAVCSPLAVLAAVAVGVCSPARLSTRAVRLLSLLGPATFLGAVADVTLLPGQPRGSMPEPLPGMVDVLQMIFGLHLLLILLLLGYCAARFAVVAVRRRGSARKRDASPSSFRWAAPVVAVSLGSLVLDAVFAGTAGRVADLHGRPRAAGAPPIGSGPVIVYPQAYDILAAGLVVAFIAVMLIGGIAWRLRWQRHRNGLDAIRREYATPGQRLAEQERPRRAGQVSALGFDRWVLGIARRRCLSEAFQSLDLFLSAITAAGLGLAALDLAARLHAWPSPEFRHPYTVPRGSLNWFWTGSSWLVSFIPLGALALMRYAYGDPVLRRRLSVLWDFGTFWPRAFHPLAPPSYGERAVYELRQRITQLVRVGGGHVLLTAHSQGSILAIATLLQLPPAVRRNVTLVTYGSPLARLYCRIFPAYLNSRVLADLSDDLSRQAADLPGWKNFHCRTDLLDGRVFAPGDAGVPEVDHEIPDPKTSLYLAPDPPPPVLGHSCYLLHPRVLLHIREVARILVRDGRAGRCTS